MSKLKGPLLGLEATGRLGNNLTFSRVTGGYIAKRTPTHPDARTVHQLRQRLFFAAGVDYWRTLTPAQRLAYETSARTLSMTGYAYFLRLYLTAPLDVALWMRFDRPGGPAVWDFSPNHYDGTRFGPTYLDTPWVKGLHFDGDDDLVEILNCPNLDFTSEDFSIIARYYQDEATSDGMYLIRGSANADGYYLATSAGAYLYFRTNQAGVRQTTVSNLWVIDPYQWLTLGSSRAGAAAQLYVNGVDETLAPQVHIDPLTSARSAKIGCYDTKASNWVPGTYDMLIVFTRHLSAQEHLNWHNRLSAVS